MPGFPNNENRINRKIGRHACTKILFLLCTVRGRQMYVCTYVCTYYCVIFEFLTALKMLMLVFWVLTPYGLTGSYQHFGGTSSGHEDNS
jgi:1,4-dihydroxy-2-naphthoate octaprenyltransferase